VGAPCSTEQGHKDDVAKKVYRKATLRWHPDKFIGKFGKLMAPADEERIMNEVKNISQAINRAWQIANY
jgi:DnaJ-class molecular chaperone